MGPQRLTGLALDLVDVGDEVVERAVVVQPLGRGLRTHTGDAGQVVAGLTDQGRQVGVALGRDGVAPLDLRRGDAGDLGDTSGRVDHGEMVGDQLERVAVAGAPRGRRSRGRHRRTPSVAMTSSAS